MHDTSAMVVDDVVSDTYGSCQIARSESRGRPSKTV